MCNYTKWKKTRLSLKFKGMEPFRLRIKVPFRWMINAKSPSLRFSPIQLIQGKYQKLSPSFIVNLILRIFQRSVKTILLTSSKAKFLIKLQIRFQTAYRKLNSKLESSFNVQQKSQSRVLNWHPSNKTPLKNGKLLVT